MLDELLSLLSPTRATATCRRKLTFGGDCDCNFRDTPDLDIKNIPFDKHMYGRRRVCIDDGYVWRNRCRVLSLQADRYSGDPETLRKAFLQFGCSEKDLTFIDAEREFAKYKNPGDFSLKALYKKLGVKSVDLLDVSVPEKEAAILADLIRPGKPRISARQLTWTVVLDADETMGEAGSSFTMQLAKDTIDLLKAVEAAGYTMLSSKANPKCVVAVKEEHGLCVPVFVDVTWMKLTK